jgi:glycosyltransferase involved in cell wall biosynthesis
MPVVSVIVPNYNHAQFLLRRLDTILSQTFADFEVIYLDDASTDNSDRVIASFLEDRRILLFATRSIAAARSNNRTGAFGKRGGENFDSNFC